MVCTKNMADKTDLEETKFILMKNVEKAINDKIHEIKVAYGSIKMLIPDDFKRMRICDYLAMSEPRNNMSKETEEYSEKKAEFERQVAHMLAIVSEDIEQQKNHIKEYYTNLRENLDPEVKDMTIKDYLNM